VVGCTDTKHYVYDAATYSVLHPFTATTPASAARFSPDGKYLAYGLRNSTVIVLNATTYAFITSISLLITQVDELDFNPTNDRLMVCGPDSYAIYTIPSWTYITGLYPVSRVMSCRFNSNGGLASGTKNGFTRVMSNTYS
jgi:WD40 repeat protein